MARAKAPEASKDAPVAPPAPPSESELKSAIEWIVAQIKAAEAAAINRLPEELRGNAFIIENVFNQELDKIGMTNWRSLLITGLLADLRDGKSDVKHDPTELA